MPYITPFGRSDAGSQRLARLLAALMVLACLALGALAVR